MVATKVDLGLSGWFDGKKGRLRTKVVCCEGDTGRLRKNQSAVTATCVG